MVRTKRIKHQKRKVYRRKTRGGQPPPSLPNPPNPSPLIDTPLSSAQNPSPELLPEYVSPHPPSPLFRRPSRSPPKNKPEYSRRKKGPYIRHATSNYALPEVLNPIPQHSPIHVSPHPPSPLFKPPSHIPPKSRPTPSIFTRRTKKPGNLRRTKSAKVEYDLRVLAQQQERINDIFARFARDSHGFDNAALDEYLESDN